MRALLLLLFGVFSAVAFVVAGATKDGEGRTIVGRRQLLQQSPPLLDGDVEDRGEAVEFNPDDTTVRRNAKRIFSWILPKLCAAEGIVKSPHRTLLGCLRNCKLGCRCVYEELDDQYRCK